MLASLLGSLGLPLVDFNNSPTALFSLFWFMKQELHLTQSEEHVRKAHECNPLATEKFVMPTDN